MLKRLSLPTLRWEKILGYDPDRIADIFASLATE